MGVEGFGLVDGVLGERLVKILENGFGESGADVADSFVGLCGGVVAREKECAVPGGTLAAAVVGAKDNQIERVPDTAEIVLLDLS